MPFALTIFGVTFRGAIFIALCSLAAALTGCVTGSNEFEDPNPDTDRGGPQFCNPTGKTGAALTACKAQNLSLYKNFDDEAKKREPWFDFAPDGWAAAKEVDNVLVMAVVREDEARAKLEAAAFVALTPTDVEFYTGKRAETADRSPYLVRGLRYYKNTGVFKVYEKDRAILVQHDSEGLEVPDETRSAVVVLLKSPPTHVYVQCGVVE